MDDSFRVRADKVFGSLDSSRSSSLRVQPSSPWSVTDDEVERREWKRCTDAAASDRDKTPCSSSFGDEWRIGSSIGLDPTLDFEEEEDEYDKVASGTEGVGAHLYMNDVTHRGSYLNSHNVLLLPNGLHCRDKDSHANHLAAIHRLKEDNAKAQNLNSTLASAAQTKEPLVKSPEDGGQPKSILKRTAEANTKSKKRVRFDPDCLDHSRESSPEKVQDQKKNSRQKARTASRVVPDYLVNPSKYTCYSFDSTSGVDEAGNNQALRDYLRRVESSNTESRSEIEDASAQLPKSVTFIPKKKRAVNDSNTMKQDKEDDNKQSLNRAACPVSIAVGEVYNEVSEVEEPNGVDPSACLQKPGRKYRRKSMSDDDSDS